MSVSSSSIVVVAGKLGCMSHSAPFTCSQSRFKVRTDLSAATRAVRILKLDRETWSRMVSLERLADHPNSWCNADLVDLSVPLFEWSYSALQAKMIEENVPLKADDYILKIAHLRKAHNTPPIRCIHLAHLGQALFPMLPFASCSPLTNNNSYFPTLWYTWHARMYMYFGGVCMRIGVTGASSPQSIPYFRHGSEVFGRQRGVTHVATMQLQFRI